MSRNLCTIAHQANQWAFVLASSCLLDCVTAFVEQTWIKDTGMLCDGHGPTLIEQGKPASNSTPLPTLLHGGIEEALPLLGLLWLLPQNRRQVGGLLHLAHPSLLRGERASCHLLSHQFLLGHDLKVLIKKTHTLLMPSKGSPPLTRGVLGFGAGRLHHGTIEFAEPWLLFSTIFIPQGGSQGVNGWVDPSMYSHRPEEYMIWHPMMRLLCGLLSAWPSITHIFRSVCTNHIRWSVYQW